MADYEETDSGVLVPSTQIVNPFDRVFADLQLEDDLVNANRKTVLKKRPASPRAVAEREKQAAALKQLEPNDADEEELAALARELDQIYQQGLGLAPTAEYVAEYRNATAKYNELLNTIFSSDLSRTQDFTVDDSFLPRADNIYEFWTGKLFLNETPFIAQMLILIQLFEEWCPDCSDPAIFEDHDVADPVEKILDYLVLLENGKCPHCHRTKTDFVKEGRFHFYKELVLLLGQRAGKSYSTGAGGAYVIHHYLKLQNPHSALGISRTTQLVGTCVAMKISQGVEALFGPIRQHLLTSTWFREYTDLLDQYKRKTGRVLYKIGEHQFSFRHRGFGFSIEGAHSGNLRGRTRIWGAADEIGHMTIDGGPTSGPLVHDAIDRSLLTIRGASRTALLRGSYDMMNALQFTISSPTSLQDTINVKFRNAELDHQVLALKLATWEVNPTLPRETFNPDFAKDPIKANCDYGAEAPASMDPFIPNPKLLLASINPKRRMFSVAYERRIIKQRGVEYTTCVLKSRAGQVGDPESTYPKYKFPTLFSFDAGYNNNSFAITILSLVPIGDSGYFKPTLVSLYEVIPYSAQCPINYTHLFQNFVYPLARIFRCAYIVADQWQSIKFLQDMSAEFDIPQSTYSLKLADFVNIRAKFYSGDIDLPAFPEGVNSFSDVLNYSVESYPECFAGSPLMHLYYQFCTVRTGKRNVEKGMGLTDDVFRALNVGAFMLDVADVQMALTDAQDEYVEPTVAPYVQQLSHYGAVGGRAGGGGSGNTLQDSRGATVYVLGSGRR